MAVINRPAVVTPEHDLARLAWRGLGNFQNENHVANLIIASHKLSEKQQPNARKQARQIRYALMQAKEYFESWSEVSHAVRPVLAYYCTMCLAIAQILWKGDGGVSLDKAREEHRHHGLSFAFGRTKEPLLSVAGAELRALPHIAANERRGTFELWHRTARHAPLYGPFKRHLVGGGSQSNVRGILFSSDARLPEIPPTGLTLLDLLSLIVGMRDMLGTFGITSSMVRCRVKLDQYDGDTPAYHFDFTVQPGSKSRIDEFLNHLEFDASAVNSLEIIEFPIGVGLSWRETADSGFRITFPEGYNLNSKDVYLSERMSSLNEFGLFYAALYIAGMLARYYPDVWIRHMEQNTEIFLAVDRLLELARERVPLLTLFELANTTYLQEG